MELDILQMFVDVFGFAGDVFLRFVSTEALQIYGFTFAIYTFYTFVLKPILAERGSDKAKQNIYTNTFSNKPLFKTVLNNGII